MKLKFCLLLLICLSGGGVFAQTPKAIEDDLLPSFQKIGYWYLQKADDTTGDVLDSLGAVNGDFGVKLANYVTKYPFTLKFPFESLISAGLDITSSDDGNLRVYSWDTGTGGDQHAISNIFQFKTENGTDTLSDVPADPYGV